MYAFKKTYVKNWSHMKPEELHEITVKKGGEIVKSIKPERIYEIVEEVAKWRKANAIHKWFVDNVQDGEDDCKEYHVSHDQLTELRDLCAKVLAASELIDGYVKNGDKLENGKWIPQLEEGKLIKDATVAHDLLPTTQGFFFGSPDYNEWYLEDIQYTFDTLNSILSEEEHADIYYSSSW